MRILIMGCGRAGAKLAELMDNSGHKVTVIDVNEYSFRRLPLDFGGNLLVGTGTDQETLRNAGIEDADVFVALTEGDNRNVMASQIAQYIFEVPKVVCRIYDPLRQEFFSDLGIDTFTPTTIFAKMLKKKIEDRT